MPGSSPFTTLPSQPASVPSTATPVGYALPVPASLVAANPKLIGEGAPAPRHPKPAGPVTLPVPAGTPVDAVTAGTITITQAGNGTSTIALSGTDGAAYTYRGVTATAAQSSTTYPSTGPALAMQREKVRAGTKIGVTNPGGLTFSISVPDVRGAVDADEALQGWAAGLSVNVRGLPSSIAGATAAPARAQALVVADSGAKSAAAGLATAMSGPLLRVRTETVTDPSTVRGHSPVAQAIAGAARKQQLVIVVLAHGTPGQAAAIAARLPAGHQILWVEPPGITAPPGATRQTAKQAAEQAARQAAAYRAIVAAHPGFRVEALPAALAPQTTGPQVATADATASAPLPPAQALATATLTATYAATAYRLDSRLTQADAALSWAEQQLGKPYKWAAAGPDTYDCSGLTMDALAQAGIAAPHNANQQWQQTKARPVARNRLAAGDLVFFAGSDGTLAAPGHVGIYVGDGWILDAPFTGARVRFDPLASITGYVGAANPYTPVQGTAPAGLIPATGNVAAPGALSQYQSFAQGLASTTWGASQFPFLYALWQRESGWNPAALNPMSGAFGIPQALPAIKMATAGLDWATNPYTQVIWGIGYIRAAYGTPQAAWAHELAFGWY